LTVSAGFGCASARTTFPPHALAPLFRSDGVVESESELAHSGLRYIDRATWAPQVRAERRAAVPVFGSIALAISSATSHGAGSLRSEEHTSELQSRENLVCRRPRATNQRR